MKKWLFSKNGKILGPFEVVEANDFVLTNPDTYAWHPSYSHWMPVTCISEFEGSIPAPKPPSVIPKELIEEFISEERKLISRLEQLDEHLIQTDQSLLALDNEIKEFQDITKNCTTEVRATLQNIEQQFANLSKNLSNFKNTTTNAKEVLEDVSGDFTTRIEKDNQPQVESAKKTKAVKVSSQVLPEEFAEALVEKMTKNNDINTKSNVNIMDGVIKKKVTTKKKKIINTAVSRPLNQISMLQTDAAQSDVAIAEAAIDGELEDIHIIENRVQAKSTVKVNDNQNDKKQILDKKSQENLAKQVSVEKIEFSDQPSKEDILLASQLKQIDKPITYTSLETAKLETSTLGEFDHILYDSIESQEQVVDEDKTKKRLRRRRRR